jgi:hypothetical protein
MTRWISGLLGVLLLGCAGASANLDLPVSLAVPGVPTTPVVGTEGCQVDASFEAHCGGYPTTPGPEMWPPAGPLVVATGGSGRSCGLRPDGTAVCWPALDAPLEGTFARIFVHNDTACGLGAAGSPIAGQIVCSGKGLATPFPAGPFADMSGSGPHVCGLDPSGHATCRTLSGYRVASADPVGTFQAIAVGGDAGCGLRGDGAIDCWAFDDRMGEPFGGEDPPAGAFASLRLFTRDLGCATDAAGVETCWGPKYALDVMKEPEVQWGADGPHVPAKWDAFTSPRTRLQLRCDKPKFLYPLSTDPAEIVAQGVIDGGISATISRRAGELEAVGRDELGHAGEETQGPGLATITSVVTTTIDGQPAVRITGFDNRVDLAGVWVQDGDDVLGVVLVWARGVGVEGAAWSTLGSVHLADPPPPTDDVCDRLAACCWTFPHSEDGQRCFINRLAGDSYCADTLAWASRHREDPACKP